MLAQVLIDLEPLAFWVLSGDPVHPHLHTWLGATLVAAAQVLVYLGAISVLILFAIMLTQSKTGPVRLVFHHQAWAAALAAIGIGVLLIITVAFTTWPNAVPEPIVQGAHDVAALLFEDYVLAFEVISVLLLAAVIGGIFLARRDEIPEPGESRPAEGSGTSRGQLAGPARAEEP